MRSSQLHTCIQQDNDIRNSYPSRKNGIKIRDQERHSVADFVMTMPALTLRHRENKRVAVQHSSLVCAPPKNITIKNNLVFDDDQDDHVCY